jgi:hypothetical protein
MELLDKLADSLDSMARDTDSATDGDSATNTDSATSSVDGDTTETSDSATGTDGTNGDGMAGETVGEWTMAESPTTKTLFGVVQTAAGPYAVGTGGNVLARDDAEWHLAVEDGPATRNNTLLDVDVTADGRRIWFAGSSGALGAYDVETGKKYDYSAPMEKTSTWEAVGVTGNRGSEELRLANGSGEVLAVTTDENGCPEWGEVVKPGSGSTIPAVTYGDGQFYAVDTSGNAFEETEEGWTDIGVKNAQVDFYDVYASDRTVRIAGGGGRVYRYDRVCENWTPIGAGEEAIHDVESEGETLVAAGSAGHVYERTPKRGWRRCSTPTEDDLWSLAVGEIDVAVGTTGVIVERARQP